MPLPLYLLTRVISRHPDQVHLRRRVHVIDGGDHEDVHDVVGVGHGVALAGEPGTVNIRLYDGSDQSEASIFDNGGL